MMATCTGGAMGASLATSGSTCWTSGCSSPSRRRSRPSSLAAGLSTLRSAKPSRVPTGTASSPTSLATYTARLTGTRGRTRTRRTTMTLVPTGAIRILLTWTLETGMRTVAIVERRTSNDLRDRGCFGVIHSYVKCSPFAALPVHGWRLMCCLSCFVTGLVGWYERVIGAQWMGRAVARNSFFLFGETLPDTSCCMVERQLQAGPWSAVEGPIRDASKAGLIKFAAGQPSRRLDRIGGRPALCVL